MNQPTKSTPDAIDAAWSTALSTIRSAHEVKNEGRSTSPRVDVALLTGFLGSGKTTVMRYLLENADGLRIAVIVNDVGDLEVDAHLVKGMTRQQISLSNGCVCCALSDDFSEQLRELSADAYDVVLVEASGVADPVNISQVIHGLPECHLDGIVAVTDPTSVNEYLNNPQIAPLFIRQLQAAHMVLVSKSDLIDDVELQKAVDVIAALSPGSRVISISHGQVEPGIVLGAAIRGVSLPNKNEQSAFRFATTHISPAGPWDPAELARLLDTTDHQLLRAKGWFSDHDDSVYELQIVGRRWSIKAWVGDAPNGIVLIGANPSDLGAAETMFQETSYQ